MSYPNGGPPNQQSGGQWDQNNSQPPTSQPAGQWPQNPPTSQAPHQQHQNWSPQPPPPGPNGQYQQQTQARQNQQQMPPAPPALSTLQPNQHPDQYNRPNLPPLYGPPYQPAPMGYPPTQPAPRQRTAIACRYCRRRKIRCSGFEQSEDGRCTNCVRFSQECVFTPVSAQTQAFVPAHTVWRGQNPPPNTQLYGAYGQPLPQGGRTDQYSPQQGQQQPGQYPPGPPQGYQQQQQMYPPQGPAPGSKRPTDEPHTPTLPPPNPGAQGQIQDGQYGYPSAPGASLASYSTASSYPAQHFTQVSYPQPQSPYPYEASRASSSPHSSNYGAPAQGYVHPYAPAPNARRQVGKVNELAGQAKLEGRNSFDSGMLQAFNRGPK